MKTIKKMVAVLFAVVLITMAPFTASAATTTVTDTIELRTQSALLIDKSGSMEDQAAVEAILVQIDQSAFDAVLFFDHRLSTDSDFVGGGNSSICEAISKAAKGCFEHITVVTDGEQWPADYSSLGIYTDLDLTIHLVEEDEASTEFIKQLQSRLVNSSLKVIKPDGSEEVVLDEYQPPIYEVEIEVPVIPEIPEPEPDEGDTIIVNEGDDYICDCDCCKCNHIWSWWWLILLLIPLLGFLLWWLFRNWKIAKRVKNSYAVVDCSNSMTKALAKLYRACRRLGVSKDAEFIRFGEGVSIEKLSFLKNVQGERCTHGTEGIELAYAQGKEDILVFSDLGFNGKPISEFKGHFRKISVVVPADYSSNTLDELRKIADEVEVLHLQ